MRAPDLTRKTGRCSSALPTAVFSCPSTPSAPSTPPAAWSLRPQRPAVVCSVHAHGGSPADRRPHRLQRLTFMVLFSPTPSPATWTPTWRIKSRCATSTTFLSPPTPPRRQDPHPAWSGAIWTGERSSTPPSSRLPSEGRALRRYKRNAKMRLVPFVQGRRRIFVRERHSFARRGRGRVHMPFGWSGPLPVPRAAPCLPPASRVPYSPEKWGKRAGASPGPPVLWPCFHSLVLALGSAAGR